MKSLSDIYGHDLVTRDDITRFAEMVAIKQRDAKRVAIDRVIDEWRRLLHAADAGDTWFSIVRGCKCATCGGVILKRVGPFPVLTCGGNPSVGCPVCETIGSAKMVSARRDIVSE